MKKGKRFLALLLSFAMVVTLLPSQVALADGGGSSEAGSSSSGDELPEKLVYLSFDDDISSNGDISIATKEDGTAELSETAIKGKALSLKENGYLTVMDAQGKNPLIGKTDALTISYWSQSSDNADQTGWAFFIKMNDDTCVYNENEGYIASIDRINSVGIERFDTGRTLTANNYVSATELNGNTWRMVTVVLTADSTTLYINGKETATQSNQVNLNKIMIDGSVFRIGKANWENGQYFTGLIDEFTVYDGALTEEQVATEYLKNESDTDTIKSYLKDYVDRQINALVSVEKQEETTKRTAIYDMMLPTSYGGAAITWSSSNPDVITSTGELKVHDGTSKSTLTANISYPKGEQTITDSSSYEITVYNEEEFTLSPALEKYAGWNVSANSNAGVLQSDGSMNITVASKNTTGTSGAAPYKPNVTADSNNDGTGGDRVGYIRFDISKMKPLDEKTIDNATLKLTVQGLSGKDTSRWVLAAVYETENREDSTESQSATYEAVGKDYSYEAAMWSAEKVTFGDNRKIQTITFDVSRALKNAVRDKKSVLVLRLQTTKLGMGVYLGEGQKPALNVSLSDKSDVTVNYVNEQGTAIKDLKTIEGQKVGTAYTYTVPNDEKVITTADGVYVHDEVSETNALTVSKVNRDPAQNTIKVAYKKEGIKSITPPEDNYIIAGNIPVFPARLEATTDTETKIAVDIKWPEKITVGETETELKDLKAGDYEVTGMAGTTAVKAKLHVLECDEIVDDKVASGAGTDDNPDKIYKLKNVYKGKIVTEFDIEVSNALANDNMSVGYTDDLNNKNNWTGSSGPRIDIGSGGTNKIPFFRSQIGDGNGNSTGNYPAGAGAYKDEAGYVKTESGKTYRVRIEIDDETTSGLYKAFITEQNGKVTKLFEGDGNIFRGWTGNGINNFFALRGGFTMKNHKISWISGWSKYTINTFVDGKRVDTVTSDKELAGTDHSAYKPSATYISEGKKAFLNEKASGWADNKSTAGDKEIIVYNANYETSEIASQEGTIELKTRVGYAPKLPETTAAKYENNILQEEEVEWDEIDKSKYSQAGTYKATGKFKGTEIPVEATVTVVSLDSIQVIGYKFDESLDDVSGHHGAAAISGTVTYTAGLDGKAASLPGGDKAAGYLNLPDTLTAADNANKVPDDFTVSFFTNRGANGDTYATVLGLTLDGENNPVKYFGVSNRDSQFQADFKNGDAGTYPKKDGVTKQGEWTHIAVVAKGSTGEAWLYENGVQVAYGKDIVMKMSDLAGGKSYIGYSSYTAKYSNPNYTGDVDEFTIYGDSLEPEEIKDICDETLYKLQIQKTKEALQKKITDGDFSYAGEDITEKFDKDAVIANIELPASLDNAGYNTTITWKSSDDGYVADNGEVYQPSKNEGDKQVTLTATISAGGHKDTVDFTVTVKEGNGLNFKGLIKAVEKAEEQYNTAVAKKIYTTASLDALKAKIDAAKDITKHDGSETVPEGMTYETINTARQALITAQNALALKGFDELNAKELLEAYYPLTENANDASGNNLDATATGVTFSEADGAHFTGGKALTSCIKIPNTLNVTDDMTFSFWAKDERGTKSNAFGIGSGNNFSGTEKNPPADVAKFFYVSTHDGGNLVASVNTLYWSKAKNITTPAAEKDAWHHVTGVLSGRKLTLYVDGEKISDTETEATLTEIWNHHPASRNIYIGNCSYGIRSSNADPDYKGNIRDFRIYGVSLEESQVKEIYGYMEGIYKQHLSAAKAGIVTALLGADAQAGEDGTYSYIVPRTVTSLTLPQSGDNWESIQWQSSDNAINTTTGAITLAETEKTVTLTAKVTVGNQTEDIVIKYSLPKEEADKTALKAAIDAAGDLTEADYTAASWTAMQGKLTEANTVYENGDATPTQVENARKALADAISNLVPIKKEALHNAIKAAESFIGTENKNEYDGTKWSALESALADAKEVYDDADATDSEISSATTTLTAAKDAMKKLSEEEKENAKKDLGTSVSTANNDVQALGITKDNAAELASTKVWDDYSTALTAAQNLAGDETASANALTKAKKDLDDALAELKATVQAKKDLKASVADAEKLTAADFANNADWEALQTALTAANTALEDSNATSSSLKTAFGNLDEAVQAKRQPPVTEVTLTLSPTTLSLKASESANLTATVTPAGTAITWDSDNPAVATVADGRVTAVKAGTAIITATAGGKSADCTVTVTAADNKTPAPTPTPTPTPSQKVTKVTLSKTKLTIGIKENFTLKATPTPADAVKSVSWSVDKKGSKIVKLNTKTGKITGKKKGKATVTVTVTSKDGSSITAKCAVTVKPAPTKKTKISVKKKSITVKAKKSTTLKPTVKGNFGSATFKFTSKNKKVAKVDANGKVTGVKKGKTTITITTYNKKAKTTVKVTVR